MIRMTIGRRLDTDRMFAIWRVDAPWQPVTRKVIINYYMPIKYSIYTNSLLFVQQGQGKRMGGGKGAIDHYVTPIKYGRIIIEFGGHCEYDEAFPILREVAEKLPFKAKPVSHKMLEEMKQKEIDLEKNNINPYTLEYIIKNNMGKCHHWISPYDRKWFMKHM
jgi:large subunit ribosomal protein L16